MSTVVKDWGKKRLEQSSPVVKKIAQNYLLQLQNAGSPASNEEMCPEAERLHPEFNSAIIGATSHGAL